MANETFNRVEVKYILNQSQYENLRNYLLHNLDQQSAALVNHESYNITNVYYDTKDDALIKNSVSKPAFKQKLRLRTYGEITNDTKYYLELKKKVKDYVNKRRTEISICDVDNLIQHHQLPNGSKSSNQQVLKEIQFFSTQYSLVPKVYIYYEREVFSTEDKMSLRLTFDQNITTRRNNLFELNDKSGKKLLGDHLILLEIKIDGNIPYWLNQLLMKNRIYETSFSKYGAEYYEYLKEQNRKENRKCINPYLQCFKQ